MEILPNKVLGNLPVKRLSTPIRFCYREPFSDSDILHRGSVNIHRLSDTTMIVCSDLEIQNTGIMCHHCMLSEDSTRVFSFEVAIKDNVLVINRNPEVDYKYSTLLTCICSFQPTYYRNPYTYKAYAEYDAYPSHLLSKMSSMYSQYFDYCNNTVKNFVERYN